MYRTDCCAAHPVLNRLSTVNTSCGLGRQIFIYQWGAEVCGVQHIFMSDWRASMTPQKALDFPDSYPIDVFHLSFDFLCLLLLGCPSKLVSIRNNRNWNRNQFRLYPKQNVCFGCFTSLPKQRVSMFRLNQNKQKTNQNSLIGSIFCYFLQKIQGFSGFFSVFFRFVFVPT